jgi:hypothetical protein
MRYMMHNIFVIFVNCIIFTFTISNFGSCLNVTYLCDFVRQYEYWCGVIFYLQCAKMHY